jgi:hypothetical protein
MRFNPYINGNNYRQTIQFGNMFCPKCGTSNPDANKHCNGCGAPLTDFSLPQPPATPPRYRSSPDAFGIGFGLVILATMYLLPIVPKSDYSVTLAEYAFMCGSPLNKVVYGCSNSSVSLVFYGGWIVAIFFLISGLFNKTKE